MFNYHEVQFPGPLAEAYEAAVKRAPDEVITFTDEAGDCPEVTLHSWFALAPDGREVTFNIDTSHDEFIACYAYGRVPGSVWAKAYIDGSPFVDDTSLIG